MVGLDKDTSQIVILLVAIFARGIKGFIEKKINYSPKTNKKRLEAEKKVQHILDNIVERLDLCRASIISYHNGNKDFNGIGFNNATMRFESLSRNRPIDKIITKFQSIPVSTVVDMLVDLNRSTIGYVIHNSEGDSESSHTAKFYGVNKAYNFLLGQEVSEGVLSLVFTEPNRNLSPEQINYVKTQIVGIKLATKDLKSWTLLGL
jgi:hypothetical protein